MIIEEQTIETNTVYTSKVFEIHSDKAKTASGEIQKREVVIHSGGVTIVAEHNDKILLVKQFRYGAQKILFELPAGKLYHNGEELIEAAKRELQEETGYTAKDWKSLGYIYSTPAICSEKIYLFYAQNLTSGKQHLDEGEFVEFFEVEKEKVFDMIKTGEISDAKTICALMRAYKL